MKNLEITIAHALRAVNLFRHWSCSTSRARTGFTKPIAAKERKKEFAFIQAKAVVPRFCST
jgi:hypothetical protein